MLNPQDRDSHGHNKIFYYQKEDGSLTSHNRAYIIISMHTAVNFNYKDQSICSAHGRAYDKTKVLM